jgi:uncharacterized membrane protein YfcA
VTLDGWLEPTLLLLAGVGAGTINVVVGSGTLITFPTLLALGVPPVTANVSNTLGLIPGTIAGVVGYRRELVGQGRRFVVFGAVSVVGGAAGAGLLLTAPSEVFEVLVPVLVALACVLVALQPSLQRRLAARETARLDADGAARPAHGSGLVLLMVGLTGGYGGYFGAAQGAILLGVLGTGLVEHLQRLNALKNALVLLINGVSGVIFLAVAPISWVAVGLIAAGSVIGGVIGSRIGRRLPPTALRATILVVGAVTIAYTGADHWG